jgi:S-formylglutathione hydrolase FrmB
MAFATIDYFSKSLQRASSFNIVFPDDPDIPRPWSVFYLLHGLSDDHTIWIRRTSVDRYVEGLPLVLVMPDGGRGWYTNALEGDAYEDDLMKDVIGLVDRTFPTKADRSGRALGGLSMGGYGAVKLGLKYPDRFASVNSHSGALGYLRPELNQGEKLKRPPRYIAELARIFGRSPQDGPEDPFALAQRADHGILPAFRVDCGTEDFLIEQNRAFHAHLNALHIAHQYEEYPGDHDWSYWDLHVQEAIRFHSANLHLTRKKA